MVVSTLDTGFTQFPFLSVDGIIIAYKPPCISKRVGTSKSFDSIGNSSVFSALIAWRLSNWLSRKYGCCTVDSIEYRRSANNCFFRGTTQMPWFDCGQCRYRARYVPSATVGWFSNAVHSEGDRNMFLLLCEYNKCVLIVCVVFILD